MTNPCMHYTHVYIIGKHYFHPIRLGDVIQIVLFVCMRAIDTADGFPNNTYPRKTQKGGD